MEETLMNEVGRKKEGAEGGSTRKGRRAEGMQEGR